MFGLTVPLSAHFHLLKNVDFRYQLVDSLYYNCSSYMKLPSMVRPTVLVSEGSERFQFMMSVQRIYS